MTQVAETLPVTHGQAINQIGRLINAVDTRFRRSGVEIAAPVTGAAIVEDLESRLADYQGAIQSGGDRMEALAEVAVSAILAMASTEQTLDLPWD